MAFEDFRKKGKVLSMLRKMIVCILSALLLRATFAEEAVLYWQVGPETKFEFTYANLYAIQDGASAPGTLLAGDGVTFASDLGDGANGVDGTYAGSTSTAFDMSFFAGEPDAWSFYVELVNSEGRSWITGSASYSDLYSQGYIALDDDFGTPVYAMGGYNFGAAVPEPSGGLLFLVGASLLALRRRNRT